MDLHSQNVNSSTGTMKKQTTPEQQPPQGAIKKFRVGFLVFLRLLNQHVCPLVKVSHLSFPTKEGRKESLHNCGNWIGPISPATLCIPFLLLHEKWPKLQRNCCMTNGVHILELLNFHLLQLMTNLLSSMVVPWCVWTRSFEHIWDQSATEPILRMTSHHITEEFSYSSVASVCVKLYS